MQRKPVNFTREELSSSLNQYVLAEKEKDFTSGEGKGQAASGQHELFTELTRRDQHGHSSVEIYVDFGRGRFLLNELVKGLTIDQHAQIHKRLLKLFRAEYNAALLEKYQHRILSRMPYDAKDAERSLKLIELAFNQSVSSFVAAATDSAIKQEAIMKAEFPPEVEIAKKAVIVITCLGSDNITARTETSNYKAVRSADKAIAAEFPGKTWAEYSLMGAKFQLNRMEFSEEGFLSEAVRRECIKVSTTFPGVVARSAYKTLNKEEAQELAINKIKEAAHLNRRATLLRRVGVALGIVFFPIGLIATYFCFVKANECKKKAIAAMHEHAALHADAPSSEVVHVPDDEVAALLKAAEQGGKHPDAKIAAIGLTQLGGSTAFVKEMTRTVRTLSSGVNVVNPNLQQPIRARSQTVEEDGQRPKARVAWEGGVRRQQHVSIGHSADVKEEKDHRASEAPSVDHKR